MPGTFRERDRARRTWIAAPAVAALAVGGIVLAPSTAEADPPQIENFCNGWGGDTVSIVSTNRVHVFTSDGTFTTPAGYDMTAKVLVVGGGAGGGAGGVNSAGGGGGGGAVYIVNSQTLAGGTTYAVTIGAGGTGATSTTVRGSDGTASSLVGGSVSLVANGGGGGGSGAASVATGTAGTADPGAGSFGSSGGGGGSLDDNTAYAGGAGSGNGGTGGNGKNTTVATRVAAGGGGGDGSNGNSVTGNTGAGGKGGNGTSNTFATGATIRYGAAGGGGGYASGGAAGTGGSGTGGANSTDPAVRNGSDGGTAGGAAGNGGGGGGNSTTATTGGSGSQGIVVISYKNNIACFSSAPSSLSITGTVALQTATLTWSAATGTPSGSALAGYTVVYYVSGGRSDGYIYARLGPTTPRSIKVWPANATDCTTANPAWTCVLNTSTALPTGSVTFKVFARTTTGGVSALSTASSALSYP